MSEQPTITFYAKFTLAVAGVLVIPAVWSLFSAILSAATTGEVLVISLGRYETARELVSWTNGWARFAGPIAIVSALGLWVWSCEKERLAWWVAAVLSAFGLVLLLFSKWFTTWQGTVWFISILAFTAVTVYVGNKYGRVAAYAIVLLAFVSIFWRIASGA